MCARLRERLALHVGAGRVDVHTIHALGLRLLPAANVDPDKAYRCWRRLRGDAAVDTMEWNRVRRYLERERNAGRMPSAVRPLCLEAAVLEAMLQDRTTCDMEDGVYHCLYYGVHVPSPGYDLVLVDEAQTQGVVVGTPLRPAQDLNDANHAFLRRCVTHSGTRSVVCAVGDPAQAVYQFRGASPHSLIQFATLFGATHLPLTCCFRCPKRVVTLAAHLNPAIRPADQADPGEVRIVHTDGCRWVDKLLQLAASVGGSTAFVTRGNAAVLDVIRYIHRHGDCGVPLVRWASPSVACQFATALSWPCETLEGLRTTAASTSDEGRPPLDGTVLLLLDAALDLEGPDAPVGTSPFLALVTRLFTTPVARAQLVLCTIHAAKGAEYNHIMPGQPQGCDCPSTVHQYQLIGCRRKEREEDRNLLYIAVTRAMQSLTFLLIKDSRHVQSPYLSDDLIHSVGVMCV